MRRLIVLALLPTLLGGGCAFGNKTSALALGEYAAVNERSTRQEATLRLNDGTSRHARNLRLEAWTASWEDPATGVATSLPVDRIAQVRYLNRGQGAKIGGTWGYLTGVAVATIGGRAMGSDPTGSVLVGLLIYGPVGWLLGLPVGAAAGADDIYQFPPGQHSP